MRRSERVLYSKVQKARESCAGDSVKGKGEVMKLITDALNFAIEWGVEQAVLDKLAVAYSGMSTVSEYKDRLPVDQILCSLLNNELEGFG